MALRLRHPIAIVLALAVAAGPVWASTDGPSNDWSLNELGGPAADRQMLYAGTPGVLMGATPASLLFIGWRRLHGQTVGTAAGEALAVPCCGGPSGPMDGMSAWLEARKVVPGVPSAGTAIETERPGPDYTSSPNCMDDAFRNAIRTLQDRVQAYGADSTDVRFWLGAQDAVFMACSKPVAALPALPDGSPAWLQADYRYQSAALTFYNADYPAAADAFALIAEDAGSPWHMIAPYLRVRALLRRALASKVKDDFVRAQAVAAAIPAGAAMHEAAGQLGGMAQLHGDPAAAAGRLTALLAEPTLADTAAAQFKDLQAIRGGPAMPEVLDWIGTFKTGAAAPPDPPDTSGSVLDQARAAEGRRVAALAHARDRYAEARDPAWLLAVLALTQPNDPASAPAIADAAALDPSAPAYLTALYQRIRLTIATADAAPTRATLDSVLARTDLTGTTRNLFLAERMLVSADLGDMARNVLRSRICAQATDGCKTQDWGYYGVGLGSFDANGDAARRGLGDDARYLIDRMALADRIAMGRDTTLPAPIRLDLALTSFARAVLVHDEASVDALCSQLQGLLPVMAAEFGAIPAARPGADRQFAEYLVFAKIPGLRVDLVDYTRPTGAIAEFTGAWPNWVVLAKPDPDIIPPAPILYDNASYQVVDVPAGTDLGDGHVRIPDVVCKGICGAGGFVPRPIPFLAATAARATLERRLLPPPGQYADPAMFAPDRRSAFPSGRDPTGKAAVPSPGAVYVWDFILSYAAAHPQDPRMPEALHWMIHVGHYGQGHDHSGKRAFMLLKSRYPRQQMGKRETHSTMTDNVCPHLPSESSMTLMHQSPAATGNCLRESTLPGAAHWSLEFVADGLPLQPGAQDIRQFPTARIAGDTDGSCRWPGCRDRRRRRSPTGCNRTCQCEHGRSGRDQGDADIQPVQHVQRRWVEGRGTQVPGRFRIGLQYCHGETGLHQQQGQAQIRPAQLRPSRRRNRCNALELLQADGPARRSCP